MRTSKGDPSNKLSWNKSMTAKLARQTRLYEEAVKVAENPNYTPRVKMSDKEGAVAHFAELLAEAKSAVDKRKAKASGKREKKVDQPK